MLRNVREVLTICFRFQINYLKDFKTIFATQLDI